jgi:hypothetical protein
MTASEDVRKAQPERIGAVRPDPVADGVPSQRRPESSTAATRRPPRLEDAASTRRDQTAETTALPPVDVPVAPRTAPAPTKAQPRPKAPRGARRATFTIIRVSPWSTFRLALLVGVALFAFWMVGLTTLYTVLERVGVWDRLNGTLSELVKGSGYDPGDVVTLGNTLLFGGAVGLVCIVLFAGFVAACVAAYNFCTELAGGVELTLAEPRPDDAGQRTR